MDEIILGLDPGVTGGYALVGDDILVTGDVPVHQSQHGRSAKIRNELDLHGLLCVVNEHHVTHVFIERVAARPGQGVTSVFRFGEAYGALYGLMVGLGLPVTFVTPQQWQKHFQIGPAPDAARQRATQLYPRLAPMLARKRDQHRADALLLACYGRHTLNGAAP